MQALSGINLRESPLLCQAKLDALRVSPLRLAVSGPTSCAQELASSVEVFGESPSSGTPKSGGPHATTPCPNIYI